MHYETNTNGQMPQPTQDMISIYHVTIIFYPYRVPTHRFVTASSLSLSLNLLTQRMRKVRLRASFLFLFFIYFIYFIDSCK